MAWFIFYRLLFLYLRAHSHRDGHSYCSSQGCERVKIQAATDSKDISNCMDKAYPQYYKKPSAVKRMPAMLTGLCQGCGTHQVSREEEGAFGGKSEFLPLAVGALDFEAYIVQLYKYMLMPLKFWSSLECVAHKKQNSPHL